MKKQMFLLSMVVGLAPVMLFGMMLRNGKQLPGVVRPAAVAAAAYELPEITFEDMLLAAAKQQNVEHVIAMLRAGADPKAFEIDHGPSQKSFLHMVAEWDNQEAIGRVLAHLKTTISQKDLYDLMMNARYRNRMPFETAAANAKCAAVIPFFKAIDDREKHFVMLAGKDIWHEMIIHGRNQNLRYSLCLLKQMDRLEEFLIERHMWGDLLLHIAARNNREHAVYALVEAAGKKLAPAMFGARNVEGLTARQVAGNDAMRGLLALYCDEVL